MASRIRVAVLFGGRSNEHSVSCVSAGSVLANLDPERFEAIAVGITRDGRWSHFANPGPLAIADGKLPEVAAVERPVAIGTADPHTGAAPLIDLNTGLPIAEIDVVFPIMHGRFGEDGTVAGQLELSGVRYVGPGVLAGAAGMDKEFTKKLLVAEGLPIGNQIVLRPDVATLPEAERERLGLPVFVKPARGGSSIGISRVASWSDLDRAIAVAREHDDKVVIEAEVRGREVECGVLQLPDGRVVASEIAEILLPSGDDDFFYDFDTKYLDDVCTFELPAALDRELANEIRQLAGKAFWALDCKGLARVDFFVTEHGPVINEINTMPGFTAISLFPRMWEKSGLAYDKLIATLIDSALARG